MQWVFDDAWKTMDTNHEGIEYANAYKEGTSLNTTGDGHDDHQQLLTP